MPGPVEQPKCEHFYVSQHQPDFPKGLYWVKVCTLCYHIIPEIQDGWHLVKRKKRYLNSKLRRMK